jgi:hypothetical protein
MLFKDDQQTWREMQLQMQAVVGIDAAAQQYSLAPNFAKVGCRRRRQARASCRPF